MKEKLLEFMFKKAIAIYFAILFLALAIITWMYTITSYTEQIKLMKTDVEYQRADADYHKLTKELQGAALRTEITRIVIERDRASLAYNTLKRDLGIK